MLQRVLQGRIVFTPRINPLDGLVDGYDFHAPTRFDKLFTGIAVERQASLPYTTEGCDGIGPEDTWDADYGQLLEGAYGQGGNGQGVTSPTAIAAVGPEVGGWLRAAA